jgi:hypothetical protein
MTLKSWREFVMSFFWRAIARAIRIGAQIVLRVRPQWIEAYLRLTLPLIAYRTRILTQEDNDA